MPSAIKIKVGQKFGRLEVLGVVQGVQPKTWVCRCECDTICLRATGPLTKSGRVVSCGCYRLGQATNVTHGESGGKTSGKKRTREHRIWSGIRSRCLAVTNHAYRYYGARGITICKRWESYENFLTDMGRSPSPFHTIERIDNDGNYEPGNCKWATRREQMRNTSRTPRWKKSPLVVECEKRGFPYRIAALRVFNGDPIELIFSPLRRKAYWWAKERLKAKGKL